MARPRGDPSSQRAVLASVLPPGIPGIFRIFSSRDFLVAELNDVMRLYILPLGRSKLEVPGEALDCLVALLRTEYLTGADSMRSVLSEIPDLWHQDAGRVWKQYAATYPDLS